MPDALREVDRFLPLSPPVAPQQPTPEQMREAEGMQNAARPQLHDPNLLLHDPATPPTLPPPAVEFMPGMRPPSPPEPVHEREVRPVAAASRDRAIRAALVRVGFDELEVASLDAESQKFKTMVVIARLKGESWG